MASGTQGSLLRASKLQREWFFACVTMGNNEVDDMAQCREKLRSEVKTEIEVETT